LKYGSQITNLDHSHGDIVVPGTSGTCLDLEIGTRNDVQMKRICDKAKIKPVI